jgi:hypothetical protein
MPIGVYKRRPNMKTGKHMIGRPAWNKGLTNIYSQETLFKIGRNNPNYKGGISIEINKKPYMREYSKEYRIRMRNAVMEILGNKCCKCGFSDSRALQIDHIKGGGNKERKEKRLLGQGKVYYKEVMESLLKNELKYQCLCANCNWIKRFENNELIGKKKV